MLDSAALAYNNPLKVLLSLSSTLFGIEWAQARVLPSDWDDESRLTRGDYRLVFEANEVVDDRIASVALPRPGEFLLLLAQLTVRRLYDDRRFAVPWFAAHFNVTGEDIQRGKVTVSLNPTAVHRVSVLDHMHRPLRHHELTSYGDNMTIKLVTDEDGTIVFLGNPTPFVIDAETIKLAVESL